MKLKGVALTNSTMDALPGVGTRIWDMADYHIPPQVSSDEKYACGLFCNTFVENKCVLNLFRP